MFVVVMPSPIAHFAVGYAIYKVTQKRIRPFSTAFAGIKPRRFLLPALLISSILPDLDFVPGLLSGQFDRYHNMIAHSLIFGVIVALIASAAIWLIQKTGFVSWFLLVSACYELHVIMDYFTLGRGVMMFWPFSSVRYLPPFLLFYGVHRSEGWLSIQHVWTLVTELGFVVLLNLLVHTVLKRHATRQAK
ncbi:MAG: metal-dependent hydrolase [Ardenticatenaceae bacterium]|nr:metal-dependent hydrolase [Ardenticatenaceae bacterium]